MTRPSYFAPNPKVNPVCSTFRIYSESKHFSGIALLLPSVDHLISTRLPPWFPIYSQGLLHPESKYSPPSPLLPFFLPPSFLSGLLPWPCLPGCFPNVWHAPTSGLCPVSFICWIVLSSQLTSFSFFSVITSNENCSDISILNCHLSIRPAILITYTQFYFIKHYIMYLCFRSISPTRLWALQG